MTVNREGHRQLVRDGQRHRLLVVGDRPTQAGDHRRPQTLGLVAIQIRPALERGDLRAVQDLVDPRSADAGQHVLVAEQDVERPGNVEHVLQCRRVGPSFRTERADRLLVGGLPITIAVEVLRRAAGHVP